ncbi:MAG: DUF128 domain-containing protein [Sedimentisphaerales bacterium]|nr:DUF128 domain-containing protein [Sedimentisphaerales bacterium]
MDIATKRKIFAILRILRQEGQPMGAAALSSHLANLGIELRERMVRYYLSIADEAGMTKNLGRRGRVITDLGRKEIDVGLAIDKVGFVAARVDELIYQMTFDEESLAGTVILNVSIIEASDFNRSRHEILTTMRSRLGMGRYLLIASPQDNVPGIEIPENHFAIATVCSITMNGVLLRHGITMSSRFGGLLELNEFTPVRFSQIINYDATTLDPIEIFIKSGMTTVRMAAMTGTGIIGASFREIPTVTLPDFKRIAKRLEQIGLGCVLMIGRPNQPLLDIPVSHGRVGVIVAGGLNPLAAAEEIGIQTRNRALHTLVDFSQLRDMQTEFPQKPDSHPKPKFPQPF